MLSNFRFILSRDMLPTTLGRPQPKPDLATSKLVDQQEARSMLSLASHNPSPREILPHLGLKVSASLTLSHRGMEEQDRCRRIPLHRLMPEHILSLELLRHLMLDRQAFQPGRAPRQSRRGVTATQMNVAFRECPHPSGRKWELRNGPPRRSQMDETHL